MKEKSKLERVLIFIASPSDVSPARERVRRAIDRINRLLAKQAGYLFEAIGWEDIKSGKGERAQEIINHYVDAAYIFIGVLHQRFGSLTGLADSGTEEEFLRIEERWNNENPKPEIWMYFKKVSPDRLDDPGPQLSKVLEFKKRIGPSVLYHEFEDESAFAENIENSLSDWVHSHREIPGQASLEVDLHLVENDIKILMPFLTKSMLNISEITAAVPPPRETVCERLDKVSRQNLLRKINDNVFEISESLDHFVVISKHFLYSSLWRHFLISPYYKSMLDRYLANILENRQHCQIAASDQNNLKIFLRTSPSAASFVLFGDTTKFDNLIEQVKQNNLNQNLSKTATEYITQTVIQQTAIAYANDMLAVRTVDEIDGEEIVGQVLRMQLSATHSKRLAFQTLVVVPMMRVKVQGGVKAGQMVSGSPDLFVNHGTLLSQMGEHDLAIDSFDKALAQPLSDELKAAALNNKGLALLNSGHRPEAKICFEEALKLQPQLQEIQNNLSLVEEK